METTQTVCQTYKTPPFASGVKEENSLKDYVYVKKRSIKNTKKSMHMLTEASTSV